MDPDQENSFMNLLTGEESQQQPRSNAPNHPSNWKYPQYPLHMIPQNYQPPYTPYYPPPQNELGGHSETSSPRTPSTPTTPRNLDSDDTPTAEVGGIIRTMGRKAAKRKSKVQAKDPIVEVTTKELSILTKLKDSDTFAKYVELQASKVQVSKEAIALRDRHQRLKELKYEDWILSMDISEMCPEDKARYSAMKEEIRSRYRQSSSSTNLD
uniref:No apical meristem-associated C-terminal domain-containing protein n=1 Tax=Opuntia streptacantha TaxID=393608 RepID=A0A7C9EU27_OPUST